MCLQSVTQTTVFFHSLVDLVVVTVDLKQNVHRLLTFTIILFIADMLKKN